MKAVVKIGGSFQGSDKLSDLCSVLNKIVKEHNIVIVPGGGQFADKVRDLQDIHGFSDKSSHWMSIKSMEIYGLALKEFFKGIGPSYTTREAKKGSSIFFPYKSLKKYPELEPTWDITSDSISAWLCGKIGYENLILIKRDDKIRGFKDRNKVNTLELRKTNQNIIDPKIPDLIDKYNLNCFLINGEKPDRIKKLLEGKRVEFTKIFSMK